MRILAASDFHGFKSTLEAFAQKAETTKAEIIVLCGDITNFGTEKQAKTLLSPLTKLKKPVLFVPGNCDPPSLVDMNFGNIKCIHGSTFIYEDSVFLGVGGSPRTPFNTFFEMDEPEIFEVLRKAVGNLGSGMNKRKIIVVSHAPPKDTRVDKTYFGEHVGSIGVRKFIEEYEPALVLCGHIHEAKGVDKIGDTLVINLGAARHGNYAAINIAEEKINANFNVLR